MIIICSTEFQVIQLAQSAGAVEYTDCISTEAKTSPQRKSSLLKL